MCFARRFELARGLSIDGADLSIFKGYGAYAHTFPRKYEVAMLGLVAPLPKGLLLRFPLSSGVLWCSPRPQQNVLNIRGCHQEGRQLEPLHIYGVP